MFLGYFTFFASLMYLLEVEVEQLFVAMGHRIRVSSVEPVVFNPGQVRELIDQRDHEGFKTNGENWSHDVGF